MNLVTSFNWYSCPLKYFTRIQSFSLLLITSFSDISEALLNIFTYWTCACYHCRPWCIWVENFAHKQCMIYIIKTFFLPWLVQLRPVICKHGEICFWGCLTPPPLASLGTPLHYHWLIALIILLNWPLLTISNVCVRLVGAVTLRVEPVGMVSGGVRAPPEIQRGVDPNCCLSYFLFSHTHAHGRGLPVGIIWASQAEKLRVFLIQPVISISGFASFSSWVHESNWHLFPWTLISRFCRS